MWRCGVTISYSSREFNQDTAAAKRAADQGPVFITDRGRTSHVLLTIDDYLRLSGAEPSIIDVMEAGPDVSDIELDLAPRRVGSRCVELD